MGNSHSDNHSNSSDNNDNHSNSPDNNYNHDETDGDELPPAYFYSNRKRDLTNLERPILLDIFSEGFGYMRYQVKANTTLKEVKEKISENIPLDLKDFFLEINESTNYDEKKIVNDSLFDNIDVVQITIHDSSPNFQVKFDFTAFKDYLTNIKNDQIEFKPYDRLNKAYQKVSSILNISSYRYKLKFNGKLIPFTDEDELEKHFIDLNLTDGSAVLKIEDLILPPQPEDEFEVFIRHCEKRAIFKASKKNIIDDITFSDILSHVKKEDLYFILPNGRVVHKNQIFILSLIYKTIFIDIKKKFHSLAPSKNDFLIFE